jgi:hypothetical protein
VPAFRVGVSSQDPAVVEQIRRLSLPDLRALCHVEQKPPVVFDRGVERIYAAQAQITELYLLSGGVETRLLGIGPLGRIDHFGHLVDGLLSADLSELGRARRSASFLAVCPRGLVSALTLFLRSPAHASVARALSQGGDWPKRVYAELGGGMSEAYATSSGAELGAALKRTARRTLLVAMLPAAFLPTLGTIAALLLIAYPSDQTLWLTFGLLVIVALVGSEVLGRAY